MRRKIRRLLARLGLVGPPKVPELVNWDLTYACPMRCGYCYADAGRRDARQRPLADLFKMADVFLAMRPIPEVLFTGGEPLLVDGFLDLATKLRAGGAKTTIYTSGFGLDAGTAARMAEVFGRIGVSLDGPEAAINDPIRGRVGGFDAAIEGLTNLDRAIAARRAGGKRTMLFGIEVDVVRSNWDAMERMCTAIAPRFPELTFLRFGAVVPTGMASRASYAARELLDEDQMRALPGLRPALARLAPKSVRVLVDANLGFQMRPEQIEEGLAFDSLLKVEADGRARAMDIYEGTVGHVLEEPMEVLWARALAHHRDPFVRETLGKVTTMQEWAVACRAIDERFAAPEDLVRIRARPDDPSPAA